MLTKTRLVFFELTDLYWKIRDQRSEVWLVEAHQMAYREIRLMSEACRFNGWDEAETFAGAERGHDIKIPDWLNVFRSVLPSQHLPLPHSMLVKRSSPKRSLSKTQDMPTELSAHF